MKTVDILKEIGQKKYEIALISTYSFDVDFFEKYIFRKLHQKDIKNVSLFVDSRELNKSLVNSVSSELGTYYNVNPITTNYSFHPKMILLLSNDKAKLIIGSGNCTMSGWFYNSEFFDVFDYYKDENEEYLNIINAAIKSFENMFCVSNNKIDIHIFEQIKNFPYYEKENNNKEISLYDSYNKSIIDQVKEVIVSDKISKIKVLVPYYDSELKAIKRFKEDFNASNIELYIQNETSTFPKEYNEIQKIISNDNINIFSGFDLMVESKKVNSTYHGKVFVFEGKSNDYCLYGSANCTLAALYNSFKDNGNYEADIFMGGNKHDFDYIFSGFEMFEEKNTGFTTLKKTDDNMQYNYRFIEGIYNFEILRCTLYADNLKENDLFKINGEQGKIVSKDKKIVLEFKIANLDNIFEIEVLSGNEIFTVTGYYINPLQIEINRNRVRQESKFKNKENYIIDSSDAEKYIELTKDIILSSAEEVSESDGALLQYLSDDVASDQEDLNEEADAYITYYHSEDVIESEKKERTHLQSLLKVRYFENVITGKNKEQKLAKSNDSKKQEQIEHNTQNTEPVYVDKINIHRIKRDFDYIIKQLKEPKYLTNVNAEYAVFNYFTVVSIFTKKKIFKSSELVNYFNNIMIETKLFLLESLFGVLDISDLNSNDADQIITQLFEIVCLVEDVKKKIVLEKVVRKCAKIFNIRNSYIKYIPMVKNLLQMDGFDDLLDESIKTSIENSFGYKTYDMVIESLLLKYNDKVVLNVKEKTLEIEITVPSIAYEQYKYDFITKLIKSLEVENKNYIESINIKYIKENIIGKHELELIERIYYINIINKLHNVESKYLNGTSKTEYKKRLSEIK